MQRTGNTHLQEVPAEVGLAVPDEAARAAEDAEDALAVPVDLTLDAEDALDVVADADTVDLPLAAEDGLREALAMFLTRAATDDVAEADAVDLTLAAEEGLGAAVARFLTDPDALGRLDGWPMMTAFLVALGS